MEYVSSNFEDNFETIKALIDDCDFIAIDTELTGLSEEKTNFYDTYEMRYKFLKDYAMKYTVTQFGMCLFKSNRESKLFEYYPMNFHLKPFSCENANGNFLMNSDTIEFLNKSQFDFNHSWKNGIPFMRYSDFQSTHSTIEQRQKHAITRIKSDIEVYDFAHLKGLILKCTEFLRTDADVEFDMDMPQDSLDKYLILNELWKRVGCINGKWILPNVVKVNEKKSLIKIRKVVNAPAEVEKSIIQSYTDRQNKFADKMRFALVIRHLMESRKTVVAHNCLLDLLHVVDKFVDKLPQDYSDFRKKINNYFPKIIDTKYMSGDEKFKNLDAYNLQDMYTRTKKEPFIDSDEMAKPFSEEFAFKGTNAFHTAHYDAMVTGLVFISYATYLGNNNKEFLSDIGTELPAVLNKYVNRIKVVHADFGSMNVTPNSIEKRNSRPHVFHMTFPVEWNKDDICRCFCESLQKPYRLFNDQMDIRWLSGTAAMVKLPTSLDAKEAAEILEKLNDSVKIVAFDKYFNNTDGQNNLPDADGFVTVKRKRSSFNK